MTDSTPPQYTGPQAVALLRKNGMEPLFPWPGVSYFLWWMECSLCGKRYYRTLDSVLAEGGCCATAAPTAPAPHGIQDT